MKNTEKTMEKIVALCKGRGFVFSGSEIYGGLANTWDYGPLGVELKNNVKKAWWKKFVQENPYNVGMDSAILMNPQTWVASGHVGGFSDPLMDCKECKERFRADKVIEDWCAENGVTLPKPVDAYTQAEMKEFVEGMLLFWNHEERGFAGLDEGTSYIEEYIIANDLVEDFSDFLKSVSGQNFKFKPAEKGDKHLICDMGEGVPFSKIRSTGTSSLTLLYFWTQKMSRATFVMIDEFDAFYHYDLSFKVCQKLFAFSNQIFVTSHNTYLMSNDLLRPDCNFIIEKNQIKPLSLCTDKELRWGNNIEKMYRGKAFEV